MPSGFRNASGVDLDALFMGRISAARADVGFRVGGTDIANRYEPIGGFSPSTATGYKSAGTDLTNLFRNASALSLTAGYNSPSAGESFTGYNTSGTPIGSLSPTTIGGATVLNMEDVQSASVPSVAGFRIVLLATVASNFFNAATINGVVFPTNIAFYNTSGGATLWRWAGSFANLVNGGVYPVAVS